MFVTFDIWQVVFLLLLLMQKHVLTCKKHRGTGLVTATAWFSLARATRHMQHTCAAIHIHDLDCHRSAMVPALKDMSKAAFAQLPDQSPLYLLPTQLHRQTRAHAQYRKLFAFPLQLGHQRA